MLVPSTCPPRNALRGKNVVLCLNDALQAAAIQRVLENEGVVVLASVSEGHRAARIALDRRPDLLLIDSRLPDGIGGVEAAELILPQFQTCVVVLGRLDTRARDRGVQVGVSGFITPGTGPDSVLTVIANALRRFRCSVLDQIH